MPSCLPWVQMLFLLEVLEVRMVCVDLEQLLASQEVLAPFFQASYDRKEFLVVGSIIHLGCQEGF